MYRLGRRCPRRRLKYPQPRVKRRMRLDYHAGTALIRVGEHQGVGREQAANSSGTMKPPVRSVVCFEVSTPDDAGGIQD